MYHSIPFPHIRSNLDLIWPWDMIPTCTDWSNLAAASWRSISCSNPTNQLFHWEKKHDKKHLLRYITHVIPFFFPLPSTSLFFTNLQLIAIPMCFCSALPFDRLLLLLLLFVSGLFFDPFLFFPLLSGFESTISVFNWLKCIESNKQL